MDSSLAKGIKNQLFREIDKDIARIYQTLEKLYSKIETAKVDLIGVTLKGIESVYAQYMLAIHFGGSERKPFLCLSTFENSEREFNT
jgi:hypothetical protein